MVKTISLILMLHCLIPQLARGEMLTVDLKGAVAMALANNHLLKAAGHEKSAAEAGAAASRSRYFPRVALEESAALTNSPTRAFMMRLDEGRFSLAGDLNGPEATGDFRTSLTLEQPLFDKRISSGLAIAGKNSEKSGFYLDQRREETAFRAASAYLDVQRTRLQLKVAEDGVRDAREHERLAKVRNEAGVGLKSDELRARTHLSEMEQQLISAGNSLQLARLRLAQVAGREPGAQLDIAQGYTSPALRSSSSELEQQAMSGRSDLKVLAAGVEQADEGVGMARAAFWPTLYGLASYQMNDKSVPFGRDNDSWLVGATLRWELFDGRQRCNEIDRAKALLASAEEQLTEQRQQAGLQVTESYLRREETGKRLEVARHSMLSAEEGVRLLSRRYENSLALMVEVLDAQTSLNRARAQVAELEAEYARTTVQLLFVSGTLLKEVE